MLHSEVRESPAPGRTDLRSACGRAAWQHRDVLMGATRRWHLEDPGPTLQRGCKVTLLGRTLGGDPEAPCLTGGPVRSGRPWENATRQRAARAKLCLHLLCALETNRERKTERHTMTSMPLRTEEIETGNRCRCEFGLKTKHSLCKNSPLVSPCRLI